MADVRLIDANALKAEIETRLKLIGCFDGYEDSQSVLAYIDNAPTVELQSNKIDEARKVIWDTSLTDACKIIELRKLIDYE